MDHYFVLCYVTLTVRYGDKYSRALTRFSTILKTQLVQRSDVTHAQRKR